MASDTNLEYMINHVFLPPKLPQEDDDSVEKYVAMCQGFWQALLRFQKLVSDKESSELAASTLMAYRNRHVRDEAGALDPEKLGAMLKEMAVKDVLALDIRAQNAGLIIRKHPEEFSFESFELSPTNNAVMECKGRLVRCFPGPAIAIDLERMADFTFREALVQHLIRLDANTSKECVPTVYKSKNLTTEIRDTVHPKLVTEMLTGILRGIGKPINVVHIHKRTRDEVLWKKAFRPWRRSPLWLLLRVALQTTLIDCQRNHTRYKSFMIFFMARLLEQATEAALASDILFVMAAKIGRRALKLSLGEDDKPWAQYVHKVVENTHSELARRWDLLQPDSDPLGSQDQWSGSNICFNRDTKLSLHNLQPYLAGILTRLELSRDGSEYNPEHIPRVSLNSSTLPIHSPSSSSQNYNLRLWLMDVEQWAQDYLNDWINDERNLTSEYSCVRLFEMISDYQKAANSTYTGNAEDNSLMLLTLFEFWVALDRCAIRQIPLLANYEPGFPKALLNPLLLPQKIQMKRLAQVELYINRRVAAATHLSSLIFEDVNNIHSFAVEYFRESGRHKELRRTIEDAAATERAQKKRELQIETQRYHQLIQSSNSKAHENVREWDRWDKQYYSFHDRGRCGKCRLKRQADELQIFVHEWPLPADDLEAKSTVFELDVPKEMLLWRDATYTLLVDVFSPRRSQERIDNSKKYLLKGYGGLASYVRCQMGRLQLASQTKSFLDSHYRFKLISQATEEDICVNNGLRYSLYDSTSSNWTGELLGRCDVQKICTLKLPPGRYESLQWALDGTDHTTNEILARQSECPRGLDQHQFYAFGALRSGPRLQWRNISRELVAHILNFNDEATYLLVVQAAWQAGRSDNNICREFHVDLEEEQFGTTLVSLLVEALRTVEANWQSCVAVRTFVTLATRLLSVSPHNTVHSKCYDFLRTARGVALSWAQEVSLLVHNGQDDENSAGLALRALELFLLCHGTYHVDEKKLPELLKSSEDVAVLIECCIGIRDQCPTDTSNLPEYLKRMLRRHEKLAQTVECKLREFILGDRDCIDNAIRRVWTGYRPGSTWSPLSKPAERWVATRTYGEGSKSGNSSLTVHYNILDGTLLINGLPLTRLPRSYELHGTYKRLFGQKILYVVPSTMVGMEFETRNNIYGGQVHFRMCGSELIIKCKAKDRVSELIPITAISGDFPRAFVHEYVHWLDADTEEIEWRRLKDPWNSSPENWKMKQNESSGFVLSKGNQKLVDIRSPTARAISEVLGPLERATHLHVILNCETEWLEINLPRMKLDFLLKDATGQLESKQFRGMVIDKEQSFGAFTGLVNKILLRETGSQSRSVLVPHGSVSFTPEGHHIKVEICSGYNDEVKYHFYQIDNLLGRLVDNGSLQSRLFKLYLHATTSHCLADKLTGRTGTEEALSGLASAATRSFVRLESLDFELLQMLGELTPCREFYPEYLRVMQTIEWKSMSPLSQHCAFYTQVASILEQAKKFQVFQERPEKIEDLSTCGDPSLLIRTAIRESSFQVHDFGAEQFTTVYDSVYHARDISIVVSRELETCCASKLVADWSTNLTACPGLLSEVESWPGQILGPDAEQDLNLEFDVRWLDNQSQWLSDHWCALQKWLSQTVVLRDKYKILFLLSTLAYADQENKHIIRTLLAFATVPELRIIEPPNFPGFQLDQGYRPERQTLIALIKEHARRFYECPESNLRQYRDETIEEADVRRQNLYEYSKNSNVESFADQLMNQWPIANISAPTTVSINEYISVSMVMERVRPIFESCHRNLLFQQYVQKVQSILNQLPLEDKYLEEFLVQSTSDSYTTKKSYIDFSQLMETPAPAIVSTLPPNFADWIIPGVRLSTDHNKLEDLLNLISSRCSNKHEEQYAKDLRQSFESLPNTGITKLNSTDELKGVLKKHLDESQRGLKHIYNDICAELQRAPNSLYRKACLLPRICQTSILSHLASDIKRSPASDTWKKCLVDYGLAITVLQRAERLIASSDNIPELLGEMENTGHQDWDPMCHPEWLLLEIENNILIRQEQAQIGQEMMVPSSGSNSVMQLNMGLGKSSVIVPIVAAALADKTKLVRVIVLKPLAMQMFQLLAKRLGGMINRRVLYTPISRSLDLSASQAQRIRGMYEDCMQTGSILLLQPEHILSFELMGLDRLLSGDKETGKVMVEAQNWLYSNSRDILDESDEILNVRFELIYTIGEQRSIELAPERWEIIQNVLGLISHVAEKIFEQYSDGLEVISTGKGSFPKLRIIQSATGEKLLEIVVRQLLKYGLPGLSLWHIPQKHKTSLFSYLMDPNIELEKSWELSASMKSNLLLLKGLFGCGVLRFALEQKRWRVNYGLDLSRSMLAVPFHAKDIPASRAEFSHPDATIVLTCLTYYYTGLSEEQIHLSFEKLLQSDSPGEEFGRWVKDAPELMPKFTRIDGINLSNTKQCSQEVFPPLKLAKGIIDFYLKFVVFPAEMKEFPEKLSSSGWDIAREKDERIPTTGFSGTNDSRYVLPLSISQRDLPAQLSTNAMVLDILLRPENSFVDVSGVSPTGVLNAEILLKMVVNLEPKIRVILDVGAQVLEMQNEHVAREWLLAIPESEAQAAIFFDHQNELCVLSRDGRKEHLQISPFAKQMDQCLVYLDESHTRGTDLKLPTDYRAVVTLGPGLPKDRLVQACMRMRKLGKGQSVLFCSSMEVQRKILDCNGKTSGPIEVCDVLRWAISETCSHTRRIIPLWATQGLRHQQRRTAYSGGNMTMELAETLREPEAQTLEQRYGIRSHSNEDPILKAIDGRVINSREKQINDIRAKCEEFEIRNFKSATLHEEQERELSPENEREQQVELPPPAKPCAHSVHSDVKRMIQDGVVNRLSPAFKPAFEVFCHTTASSCFESTAWPNDLLVTNDFAKTVQAAEKGLDWFLRPVHWVVNCYGGKVIEHVVLSPFEVDFLLPSIRQSKCVTLHVYAPRINKSVRTLETLSFCAIPAVPETTTSPPIVRQLNLFAGQLYIRSYEEYTELCGFLGLSHGEEDHVETDSDGFVKPNGRTLSDSIAIRDCQFQTSPIPFLAKVFALRRKGHSFAVSHIGKMLKGELLDKEQIR